MGIPGFNDFAGSLSLVSGDLQASRFREIKDSRSNTYMGFAVDYCSFASYPAIVIVATPKHSKFNGKASTGAWTVNSCQPFVCQVDLIEFQSQQVIYSLSSSNDTKGEFFGASLLSIPVGRSLDHKDLLVGAPLFSTRNRREVGRVYYYRNIQEVFRQPPLLITPKFSRAGAHFGTTLRAIDLNLDTFTGQSVPCTLVSYKVSLKMWSLVRHLKRTWTAPLVPSTFIMALPMDWIYSRNR